MFTPRYGLGFNVMQAHLSVYGAMAQVVSHRPLTAEYRLRSQVSPCEICDGQRVTVTGFFPITSDFPCQYHSTNAPYSSPSTCLLLPEGKRAKPGNPNKQCCFGNRGTLYR